MVDWFDTLSDALYHIAELVSYGRTPRQVFGIFAAAITLLFIIVTVVTLSCGNGLPTGGWFVIGPLIILPAAAALYGLLGPSQA